MDNFYNLLQKIEKRPALYLGHKSIFSLQAFLDGYYYARRELEIPLRGCLKSSKGSVCAP